MQNRAFSVTPAAARACVEEIQREVAYLNDITLEELLGESLKQHHAWPRQCAMYIAKQRHPELSLVRIGRLFQRHHTAVMHALAMVERRKARGHPATVRALEMMAR